MSTAFDELRKGGSSGSNGRYNNMQDEEVHDGDEGDKRVIGLDEALEEVGYGRCQIQLYIICGLAFAADAMEVSLLSFMSPCAGADWDLTDAEMSSITSVVFAGELISALFWGPVADKYGRKVCFIVACAMIFVAGLLSAFAPDFWWLLFLRGVVGFGVGGLCVPFDLLAEFLPASKRGPYLLAIEFFWTIGSCFVAGMAWLTLDAEGWRFLTAITSIPVGLSLISAYFLLESPRWLVTEGRVDEAKKILDIAAQQNGVTLKPYTLHSFGTATEEEGNVLELLSSEFRLRTAALWTIWIGFGFAYYGVILFISRVFSTDSDDDDNDSCSFQYEDIFISACSEIAGVFIWMNLVDRIGRRHSQGSGYFLGAVGALLFGVVKGYNNQTAFATIARLGLMGASSATWVATPEVYPTRLRATGHSIANAVARLGAFASPYVVGTHALSDASVGIILSIGSFAAGIAAYFLPETAGKGLDETDERDSVHRLSEVLLPDPVDRSHR